MNNHLIILVRSVKMINTHRLLKEGQILGLYRLKISLFAMR